jgi:hypothetical protein
MRTLRKKPDWLKDNENQLLADFAVEQEDLWLKFIQQRYLAEYRM